jgi:hypothetical protein|nr:MAG TPA: hypothetical protein [Caudoviricetes sp.]
MARKNLCLQKMGNCPLINHGYRNIYAGHKIQDTFVTQKPRIHAGLKGAVTKLQELQAFYKLIGRHICVRKTVWFWHYIYLAYVREKLCNLVTL